MPSAIPSSAAPPSGSVMTPGPTVPPSGTPIASPSTPVTSALPWPWPTVALAKGVVHRVPFPSGVTDNRIESSGPLAVFTQPVACDSRSPIWLVDLAAGTLRKLYVPSVPVCIFEPAISGTTVAWMESQGSSTWRVETLQIGASRPTTIATFSAPTERAEVIRLDGHDLAYVTPGAVGQGDTIHLVSLPDLQALRTLQLSEAVYKLALAGTSLFWSQGAFTPPPQLAFHDTSAWLSSAANPTPRKITDNAFAVGFDGTWMVWVRDLTENGNSDQVLALRTGQSTPIVLSPLPQPNEPDLPFRSIWPSVGAGLAAWSIDGPQTFSLVVWPIGASDPVGIAGTSAIAGTSVKAGWLDWNEGLAYGGAKVTDLLTAIASAGLR